MGYSLGDVKKWNKKIAVRSLALTAQFLCKAEMEEEQSEEQHG